MRPALSLLACFAVAVQPAVAASRAAESAEVDDPCNGSSTPAINACYAGKLEAAETRMDRYLQAAIERYADRGEDAVVLGMRSAQEAFDAYRRIECATVYEDWKDGTIRTVMELSCSIALTDQRTHVIWANWLTYADSTPPLLPEPAPTE